MTALENLYYEIQAHQELVDCCPGVVKIKAIFEDRYFVYLIQEYISGGTLLDLLKSKGSLPETQVKLITYELLYTLETMHARGFIHRDIKLENVLISHED